MSFDVTSLGIALRNLLRQRTRTLTSLCAISVGVACLIVAGGFVKDILFQLGEATIHSQTGHLQIATAAHWKTHSPNGSALTINSPQKIKDLVLANSAVDQVAARINFVGMLNNGKRDLGIIGEGVEPDQEAAIGSFMRYTEGRPLRSTDHEGIAIGYGIAKNLDLKVGDYVTLVASLAEGALNTAEFRIVGIFQSFSKEFDARAIRIPLPAANDLLDKNGAHLLIVTLRDTQDTPEFLKGLKPRLADLGVEARDWKELSDFYEKTVQLYDAQFGVLRLIIFCMVLLSVANSINMSLYERTREFGTVLALGTHPNAVFWAILTESILLGLIGSIFGTILALTISWGISLHGIPMPPPPNANIGYLAKIRPTPELLVFSALVGLASTICAAIIPARRASQLQIVDALRHGV